MPQPLADWRHQREAAEFIERLNGRGMLGMEMRTGKTRVALSLAIRNDARAVLVLCPHNVVPVWPRQLALHYPDAPFVISATTRGTCARRAQDMARALANAKHTGRPFLCVVNYEAFPARPLFEWLGRQEWDWLFMDECVPAGTMIDTPAGHKQIEDLRAGDVVWGYDHDSESIVSSRIKRTFRKQTTAPLMDVMGVPMTPEHPVWTREHGYIPACRLGGLYTMGRIEYNPTYAHPNLRMVRAAVRRREAGIEGQAETVLRNELLCEVAHVTAGVQAQAQPGGAGGFLGTCHADAAGPRMAAQARRVPAVRSQPLPRLREAQGDECQGAGKAACAGVRAPSGRERARLDSAATDTRLCSGLAARVSNLVRHAGRGVLYLLQGGSCGANPDDRSRGRWGFAPVKGKASRGCQEGRVAGLTRMDNPEGAQSGCDERPSWCAGQDHGPCEVFNLETETGNYFAGGLLVHNCHHLKAVNGQRSKAAARLAAVIPNKVALTGTPCPHSPLDVWAQFRAVNPAVWGSSYHRFRNRYAVMGGYQQHEVVAYQNLAEFNARLSQHCFRVRTADVLDMPETLDVTRYVELSPATRKVYDTFQRDLVAEIGSGVVTASNALVKLLRLSQIAGGHTKDTISEAEVTLSREKADDLKEFLSELTWWEEGGVHKPEPVVVFCRFIPDLANVRMVCKELGLSYLECSGRHKEQHEWRAGRGTVLGVQLEAGGEGEDFTRAAYHVFYSNSYSLGTYEQCRARGTGSEQRRNLTYVHIVAQDTIDEVVYAALEKREEVVRFAVDAMRPEKRVRKATPQEQLVYA